MDGALNTILSCCEVAVKDASNESSSSNSAASCKKWRDGVERRCGEKM
jgi:hypothetical protein